jgi:hypothetical protein
MFVYEFVLHHLVKVTFGHHATAAAVDRRPQMSVNGGPA